MPAERCVYPVFEDEKSTGSDEKSGQAKNCIKKDQQDQYDCYTLRLRAIKNDTNFGALLLSKFEFNCLSSIVINEGEI